jgi:hypothetical protein
MKRFILCLLLLLLPLQAKAQFSQTPKPDTSVVSVLKKAVVPVRDTTPPKKDSIVLQPNTSNLLTFVVDVEIPTLSAYEQPAIYAKLWRKAMWCSQLYIPMSQTRKVHFFTIEADAFTIREDPLHNRFVGYTLAPNDQILLVWYHTMTAQIVEHEMVHYLMWHNGLPPGHPDKYYKNSRCQLR